jgi:phosphoserine aminotransferase
MTTETTSLTDTRVFNFSAGPAVMPLSVLKKVQDELLSLPGAGASILEISHRSPEFERILESAERNLRELLTIPDNYKVLFLQGGARLLFSIVPMNLLKGTDRTAHYLLTGSWGKKALEEAVKEGSARAAWDGKSTRYSRVPADQEIESLGNAAYAYFTSNETIEGVQYSSEPSVGDVPLVCDASSDFLHRPLAIDRYGLLFACAQKNAGPAGVSVVIVRSDLLDRCSKSLPSYCNLKVHDENKSMFNTPPTFAIYVLDLIVQWLLHDVGGLEAMWEINRQKARILYDTIDGSDGFYAGHAEPPSRSLMNVTFRLPNDSLQAKFLSQAADRNLCNLEGHRSVGGIRASIYNAMPLAGVESLKDFMVEFKRQNG